VGLRDIIQGKRCDMCGQRKDDVGPRSGLGRDGGALNLCTKCSKAMRRSDRSKPHGSADAGYRPGQPPKLAGPMGSRYRGPTPPPQRRK